MKAVCVRGTGCLLVLGWLSVMGACASLPLPGTPDEALVVIATGIAGVSWPDGGGTVRVAGGQLHFVPAGQGHALVASLAPGRRYVALAVPPGQYYLSRVVLDMEYTNPNGGKSTWQDNHQMTATFYAGPNSVQIFVRRFVVSRRGQGGYNIDFNTVVDAQARQEIRGALMADRRWPAWEEYQLVNFE